MIFRSSVIALFSLLAALAACGSTTATHKPQTLPSRFDENRILLVPELEDGTPIVFYTDSGGGFNAIEVTRARSMLSNPSISVGDEVAFPKFTDGRSIPSNPIYLDGKLKVVEDGSLGANHDGFLGGRWFGDKIWGIDYGDQELVLHHELSSQMTSSMNTVPLGFQTTAGGNRTMHFPRMTISVLDRDIDMLFDTGAMATLTADSAPKFAKPIRQSIGTSFMCAEVFDSWRKEHPEWPYIENADAVGGSEMPMLQVPSITIAGLESGSVWFARRPDAAFKEYMSSWMDQPICGAVGGSVLRYFRLIIDYPKSELWVELVDD